MFKCHRLADEKDSIRRDKNHYFIIDTKYMRAYCTGYLNMFADPISQCANCPCHMDARDVNENDRYVQVDMRESHQLRRWR